MGGKQLNHDKGRSDPVLTFISGSSFPCLLVPFLVLGTAMLIRPEQNVPPHTLLWGLPVIMGVWNICLTRSVSKPNRPKYFLAGAILGLCFTILGVSTGAPAQLYGLSGMSALIMIPIGTISHSFIWGVIVYWVNHKLGVIS